MCDFKKLLQTKKTNLLGVVVGLFVLPLVALAFSSPVSASSHAEWVDRLTIRYNGKLYVDENPGGNPWAFIQEGASRACESTHGATRLVTNDDPYDNGGAATFRHVEVSIQPTEPPCSDRTTNVTVAASDNSTKEPTTDPDGGGENGTGGNDPICITNNGLGWLICPLSEALAAATIKISDLIERLLIIDPLPLNPGAATAGTAAVYHVWSGVRNIANIVLVFGFFAIVFSQATSIGISSYGIKKLLPRLVVVSIAINLSYFICALAIDVFNLLGAGVAGLFSSANLALPTPPGGTGEETTIGAVAATSVTAVMVFTAAVFTGWWTLILPALGIAVMGFITAFLVLAFREVAIILLVIISPLAFAASLLPNTNSWFDKWKTLFTNLLIMYPLLMGIVYGSILTSNVIRATAGATSDNRLDDVVINVMSLMVLAVPLFALPFLIKLAGGIGQRIGAFTNNSNRGPIDRLRKRGEKIRGRSAWQRGKTMRERARDERKTEDFVGRYNTDKGWKGRTIGAYTRRASGGVAGTFVPAAIRARTPGLKGAQADITQVERLAREQAKKQLKERVMREDQGFESAGVYSKGSTYWEVDENGNQVYEKDAMGNYKRDATGNLIALKYSDHGRAMAAIARGAGVKVNKPGTAADFGSATGVQGNTYEKRLAAMHHSTSIGDAAAVKRMLYGDELGEGAIGDHEVEDFMQFVNDNAGKVGPKLSHLVTGDEGLKGVNAVKMADWHGTEFEVAASRIRQLRQPGANQNLKLAQDIQDSVEAAYKTFANDPNMSGQFKQGTVDNMKKFNEILSGSRNRYVLREFTETAGNGPNMTTRAGGPTATPNIDPKAVANSGPHPNAGRFS